MIFILAAMDNTVEEATEIFNYQNMYKMIRRWILSIDCGLTILMSV